MRAFLGFFFIVLPPILLLWKNPKKTGFNTVLGFRLACCGDFFILYEIIKVHEFLLDFLLADLVVMWHPIAMVGAVVN